MLREIVLDTETTGTDVQAGDRLIEIGCVELVNHIATGRTFHRYVNPQRMVSQGAFAVHGLSDAFLADKPTFAEIADDFLSFCEDATLVIHNAAFDVGFINEELRRAGRTGSPLIALENVVDTLVLARRRHPGAANSLDALCSRYGVDTAQRTKHGALLDSQLLAEVYIELLGGKQTSLGFTISTEPGSISISGTTMANVDAAIVPPHRVPTAMHVERHADYVRKELSNPIWHDYSN